MKVLITGGTGFIGSRLALKLLDDGHSVRVFGQINNKVENANAETLKKAGAECWLNTIVEQDAVAAALEGVDLVFHFAAAQHEANVSESVFWDVNVKGTQTIVDESIRAGVRRFIHGSTIGVFGSALEGTIDEKSPCKPDNIYGVTKYAGEKYVLENKHNLPVVVVRISETYGPGDRRLLKLFKGVEKGLFPIIGKGENLHHLIYVDDLIDGFLLCAEKEAALGQVFILAGKEPITTNEMIFTIARVLGKSKRILRLPMLPFMMLAVLMELVLSPLGIQPPLHRRRMDFFKKSYLFSQIKAASVLGFDPKTAFIAGAQRTADWYRNQGLI